MDYLTIAQRHRLLARVVRELLEPNDIRVELADFGHRLSWNGRTLDVFAGADVPIDQGEEAFFNAWKAHRDYLVGPDFTAPRPEAGDA